jgi:hypothetical protein
VDLTKQLLYVVNDGRITRILPVSSGNGAHYRTKNGQLATALTPVGRYVIQRRIVGVQVADLGTLYDPEYFYKGWAIHGSGSVPGYPASHGCIRMPAGFARLLYGSTKLGMTVVIADVPAAPRVAPTPTIVFEGPADESNNSAVSWVPEKSPSGPVSVLVSASDHRALVLRNGIVIGSAPVTVKGVVTGTWAYALRGIDQNGQHWVRLQLSGTASAGEQVSLSEWQRFIAPDAFKKAVASVVQPGMTIVVTSDSLRTAAAPVTVLESGT